MARAPASLWSSASGRTQPSTETPVRSTSMGCACAGSSSSACFNAAGRAAQTAEARLVRCQFRRVGQFAVHQQVRHFVKLAVRGQVGDVVAAIVQIVAALAHGADRGVAGRGARQRDRLLGFEGRCRVACSLERSLFDPREIQANESKQGMSTLSSCSSRTTHPASARRRGSRDTGKDRRASASAAARSSACPRREWSHTP